MGRCRPVETFQSAPHFSSEANTREAAIEEGKSYVSIRASLQQRGEHCRGLGVLAAEKFQSRLTSAARRTSSTSLLAASLIGFNPRLTSAARRTSHRRKRRSCASGFNPRLTSAARRTWRMRALPAYLRSFNPRLTSAARRTNFMAQRCGGQWVSIRASLQQRGEPQRLIIAQA